MKFSRLFYLLLSFLWACEAKLPSKIQTDNFKELPNRYAKRFIINEKGDDKIIFLFSSKNSLDTSAKIYLYKNVKPQISHEWICIKYPVKKIVALSSLFVGYLNKVNALEQIGGIDNKDYVCNNFIQEQIKNGKVIELSRSNVLNHEACLALQPDLVLNFGMGDPINEVNPHLVKNNIPMIITADHLEDSPLARAEWLKVIAAFVDKLILADSIFENDCIQYLELKKIAAKAGVKPSVITEMKYQDSWFMPGGKSFMAQFIHDAGGDFPWKNDNNAGSLQLSFEEVLNKGKEADFWLNLLFCNTKSEVLKSDPRYSDFKAFKSGNLFNNNAIMNKSGGNAYWEDGLVTPHEILSDILFILHPELLPNHQLKYYRKLKDE